MTTLHLLPAAAPATQPRSLPSTPRPSGTGSRRRLLPGVVSIFRAAWRWIIDGSEFRLIERRPLHALRCDLCGDVHEIGETCELQQVGDCDICGTVRLDYYGNCAPAGERWRNHCILNRRTWADEMRRHRASNVERRTRGAFQSFRARVQGIAVDRDGKIDLREPEKVRERVLCGLHGRQVPHDGRCPKCGGYGERIINLRPAPTPTADPDQARPARVRSRESTRRS